MAYLADYYVHMTTTWLHDRVVAVGINLAFDSHVSCVLVAFAFVAKVSVLTSKAWCH